jgi:hypothetical protein
MRVHLLHADRDFDLEAELPPQASDLTTDLGLDILFGVMAAGDRYLLEAARRGFFASLAGVDAIDYRQAVLADLLDQPQIARDIYATAGHLRGADPVVR